MTFNVNTENITVGPNGMYLGGGVFGDAQAHAMSDDDGDGTYTVTVAIPEGTSGNYIFLNSPNDGGDWGAKENLAGQACADPGNYDDRILPAVTGPTTYSTCFGECSTDGTCGTAPESYSVTFQVDMSDYSGSYGTVNLNGSFAGWCGGCIAMDDSDGDMVYTVSVDIAADTIEYKFTLDGWTAQEEFAGGESCTSTIEGFTNRSYIVAADATLPVVCYNSCDACEGDGGGGTNDTFDVTFNVNTENITVGPNGMYLGGGVFGDAQAHAMSDTDGDGTYTVTVNVAAGLSGNYIFLNSPNDGGDWEPRRTSVVCPALTRAITTTESSTRSRRTRRSAPASASAARMEPVRLPRPRLPSLSRWTCPITRADTAPSTSMAASPGGAVAVSPWTIPMETWSTR